MIFILAAAMVGCGNNGGGTDNNFDAQVSGQPEEVRIFICYGICVCA